jgi:hypothetical protein
MPTRKQPERLSLTNRIFNILETALTSRHVIELKFLSDLADEVHNPTNKSDIY